MGEMGVGAIASAISQNAPQIDYNSNVSAQAALVEGQNQAREVRPVENTGDSAGAKAGTQSDTTTRTIIDDQKVVVFTRYDSEGKEINKVPPGYDETA